MHNRLAFFLLSAAVASLSISCKHKNRIFKLNPLQNEVYAYAITKTSIQEWSFQNIPHKTFDTVRLNISLEELKKNADRLTFKLTFDSLKQVPRPFQFTLINAGSKILNYNPFATLDSICGALRGLSIQVYMSPDATVTDVRGIEELLVKISKRTKIGHNIIKAQLSDFVSVNAVSDLLNRMLSIPFNKEVKVSDSWVKNLILVTKAPVKLSNMYVLEKLTGDTAYVSIKSMVSTSTTEGGNIYLRGNVKGEAVLSFSTGMPYRYETNLESITKTTSYDVSNKEQLIVSRKIVANPAIK